MMSTGLDEMAYPIAEDIQQQHEEEYGKAPEFMVSTFEFWAQLERMKLLVESQRRRIDELERENKILRLEDVRTM